MNFSIKKLRLMVFLVLVMAVAVSTTSAQTFRVLHNFSGGADGAMPYASLTMDRAGNIYGTASAGGQTLCPGGCGTVFRLAPSGSGWLFTPIYKFAGDPDGSSPRAPLAIGPDGSLYGTTFEGGNSTCYPSACGTVFRLRPAAHPCHTALCAWNETVIYSFGQNVAAEPSGNIAIDPAGNIYGTTLVDFGTVYKISPSGNGWTGTILHQFDGHDGQAPYGGVVFDASGNLYGTTYQGGGNYLCSCGVVFELSYSDSGWNERILYQFQGGASEVGINPRVGVVFDSRGNLYGASGCGGPGYGGTVYELLAPSGIEANVLHAFSGTCVPGPSGPWSDLAIDASGNLYGTTYGDGQNNFGNVFRLTLSNGTWTYADLYDFSGALDGSGPVGGATIGTDGNLYGTTIQGGAYGEGVVWEIAR
jgi:uncharacterized repeat protein (TIGR03803 family)